MRDYLDGNYGYESILDRVDDLRKESKENPSEQEPKPADLPPAKVQP